METWVIVVIILAVFAVVFLIFVGLYNGLQRKRIDTDNAWAQIDVQLKRRYDLIPNLVETVKGYASHERETLDAVISARQQAVTVTADAAHAASKAQAEGVLSGALTRLLAVAEAYPQLKADANFRQLQEELSSTENKIGFARQHYNDTVGRYEEARQTFPSNLVSAMFNFKPKEYFKLEESAQREAPKVSFK